MQFAVWKHSSNTEHANSFQLFKSSFQIKVFIIIINCIGYRILKLFSKLEIILLYLFFKKTKNKQKKLTWSVRNSGGQRGAWQLKSPPTSTPRKAISALCWRAGPSRCPVPSRPVPSPHLTMSLRVHNGARPGKDAEGVASTYPLEARNSSHWNLFAEQII